MMHGTFNALVPKTKSENVLFRLWLLDKCRSCANTRRFVREMCKQDILFFINVFVWQVNPKKDEAGQRTDPFVCWDFQEAILLATPENPYKLNVAGMEVEITRGILWCKKNNRTVVVEKSREMGASWLFLIYQLWLALFFNHSQMLNISRSEEAVDDGTNNSLFGKIAYVLDHLPDWMKGDVEQHKMRCRFGNSSLITGVASKGSSGAGGRARIIFIDEFSLIREDVAVRGNTASIADCRFFNGTHVGTNTEFFRMTDPELSPEVVKLVIHWTQHPEKNKGLYRSDPLIKPTDGPNCHLGYEILDQTYQYPEDFKFDTSGKPHGGPFPGIRSPWYDWKCQDIGIDNERKIKEDLDIDARGSGSQFFKPEVIHPLRTRAQSVLPHFEGDVEVDYSTGELKKMTAKRPGRLLIWTQLDHRKMAPVACYGAGGDVSGGGNKTPSCLSIVDAHTGTKVLSYYNAEQDAHEFGATAYALLSLFKDKFGTPPLLAWEKHGPGLTFGRKMVKLDYGGIYFEKPRAHSGTWTADGNIPGWSHDKEARRGLLEEYRRALRTGDFTNHDPDALAECLNFLYLADGSVDTTHKVNREHPERGGVNHGDMVYADALAWKMAKLQGEATVPEEKPSVAVNSLAFRRMIHEHIAQQQDEPWG